MPSTKKRANPEGARNRRHVFLVWKALGSTESVRDMWMDAETWVRLLKSNCTLSLRMTSGIELTETFLNEVVWKDPILKDVVGLEQNNVGLYRHEYYGGPDGKRKIKTYQWRTPGEKRYDPLPKSKYWSERLYDPFWSERGVRAQQPAKKKARTEPADDDEGGRRTSEACAPSRQRHRAIDINEDVVPPDMVLTDDSDSDSDDDDDSDSDGDSDDSDFDPDDDDDLFGTTELPPGTSIYYVSTEAKKLFAAQMGETAYDAIEEQIKICLAVCNNQAPYDSVIIGGDDQRLMTEYAVYKTRMQCHFISKALQIRLDTRPDKLDWRGCCKSAVLELKRSGLTMANNSDTVMGWYRSFREDRQFPNPSKGKAGLPPFLQSNPKAAMYIQAYAKEHLKDLDSKLILEYLNETLIPKLMREENVQEKKKYLKKYGLTKLCPRTVINWLHALGFRYEEHRKNFYVDNHEDPGTVRYRWKFVHRYLLMETRAHRWIQITKSEMLHLSKKHPILLEVGFEYVDKETDIDMVEFHVDTIPEFQDRMTEVRFGGNLSMRFPPGSNPLFIIGQDECIFKQYLFRMKRWQHGKTRAAMPKDDGAGVMISGFTCRELGWGLDMTEDELRRVNEAREGQNYTDELAAKAINKGAAAKPKLTHSPFVELFHYGASAEGYWTYDRMVLQVEDVVDCIKVLYPQYDVVFMFDHSCGHDRSQPCETKGYGLKRHFILQTSKRAFSIKNIEGTYFHGRKPKSFPSCMWRGGALGMKWTVFKRRVVGSYETVKAQLINCTSAHYG